MAIVAPGGIITQELWDSIALEAAAVEATLFTVPMGQAGKTLYNTNMRQGGQLQKGWDFEIMALSWHVVPDKSIDDAVALSKGTYEVHVSDKVWAEGLLNTLPSGGGLAFNSDFGGPFTAVRFGSPDSDNLKQLSRAIPLKAAEGFHVEFSWPAAPGEGLEFWFVLHGELQRGLN